MSGIETLRVKKTECINYNLHPLYRVCDVRGQKWPFSKVKMNSQDNFQTDFYNKIKYKRLSNYDCYCIVTSFSNNSLFSIQFYFSSSIRWYFYVFHTRFFCNAKKGNARLKTAKNQTDAKQHFETELLLIKNYSLSSSTLSSKSNSRYSKKCTKASTSV